MSSKGTPLSLAMGSEVVTIFVGKKRKEFIVHKKLLCEASKFFNDAFNGPFKEGKEGTMYMPEDDSDVFSYFVDWLYRNPVPVVEDPAEVPKKNVEPTKADEPQEFGPPTKEEHEQRVAQAKKDAEEKQKAQDARLNDQIGKLLKLYFFAEKIFINELMDRTMDRIRLGLSRYDRYLGHREVKQIYLNTSKGSELRKFCSDLLVYNLGSTSDQGLDQLIALQQELPELAKDILRECKFLADYKREICWDDSDGGAHNDPRMCGNGCEEPCCVFHTHGDSNGERCYKLDSDEGFNECPVCGFGGHWGCVGW